MRLISRVSNLDQSSWQPEHSRRLALVASSVSLDAVCQPTFDERARSRGVSGETKAIATRFETAIILRDWLIIKAGYYRLV